jgi:hypothetical protein
VSACTKKKEEFMLHVRKFKMILSLLILVVATAPSFAASQTERDRLGPMTDIEALSRFQPTQIRAYREQLNAILARERGLVAVTGQEGLTRLVDQRIDALQKIGDADFARFMSLNVDLGPLDQSVTELQQRVEAKLSERVTSQGLKITPNSPGFPNAEYSFCGSARNDAVFMLAAQEVLITAKGVWSIASRGCDEVVVVAGFGGNVSLVCTIADGILAVAEGVLNGFEFCDNDIDSAEINGSYRRLEHIHGDLSDAQTAIVGNQNSNKSDVTNAVDAAKTAITNSIDVAVTAIISNDNTNKNTIVNNDNANRNLIVSNDNANRDTIVNNDNANRNQIISNDNANRDLIISNALRLAIEQNLSDREGSPTEAIALFQLPAPAGYLDLVRSIVRQTIDNMKANGQNVFQAENFYLQAADKVATGKFKEAFRRYQKSYQEATKTGESD